MPLYEYACQSCETVFEELVRGDEKIACPKCRGRKLERLFSVPARPQSGGSELPRSCNNTGPPCGSMCGRWRGE